MIFKFNSSYEFNDDVMTLRHGQRGFPPRRDQPGSACEVPPSPVQNFCLATRTRQPDQAGHHDELRTRPAQHLVRRTAAAQCGALSDRLERHPGAGHHRYRRVPIIVNGGTAETRGIELTARWSITDSLEFATNMSFNDAQLTAYRRPLVDGEAAFDGDRLSGSPEQQGTMLLSYSRPLAQRLDGAGGLFFTRGQRRLYESRAAQLRRGRCPVMQSISRRSG